MAAVSGRLVTADALRSHTLVAKVSIGADIGQKVDPTAIVVAEAIAQLTGRMRRSVNYGDGSFDQSPERETRFEVRSMERLPLGTSYPDVAARIAAVVDGVCGLFAGSQVRISLTVDATGVGAPVVDIVRQAVKDKRVTLVAATFTHGDRLAWTPGLSVGKAYLVSRLQALMQTDRIKLPANHKEAEAMARELQDYEIRVDTDANDKYGAFRVGAHDDLVTALGLAVLRDPLRGGSIRSLP